MVGAPRPVSPVRELPTRTARTDFDNAKYKEARTYQPRAQSTPARPAGGGAETNANEPSHVPSSRLQTSVGWDGHSEVGGNETAQKVEPSAGPPPYQAGGINWRQLSEPKLDCQAEGGGGNPPEPSTDNESIIEMQDLVTGAGGGRVETTPPPPAQAIARPKRATQPIKRLVYETLGEPTYANRAEAQQAETIYFTSELTTADASEFTEQLDELLVETVRTTVTNGRVLWFTNRGGLTRVAVKAGVGALEFAWPGASTWMRGWSSGHRRPVPKRVLLETCHALDRAALGDAWRRGDAWKRTM